MNNTTKEMNENTKELKAISSVVEERTVALEYQLTFKESHDQMMKHLDWLFMERGSDVKGVLEYAWDFVFGINNDPDLFGAAGGTIMSMHFQFWKGQKEESLEDLDRRLELGSETLFVRLFKHVPRDGEVDVWRPNFSYKGMAALGAKLDMVNYRFIDGLKKQDLPLFNYYDLIVLALKNREALERKELLPKAVAKILQWEHEAIYLLQLRHNMLPMMVVSRITDFQDRKDLRRLLMSWNGQTVDLSRANPEELKEWTHWLQMASRTRQDLRNVGIEPKYNSMFASLVAGVDFGQKELLKQEPRNAQEKVMHDFAEAYQRSVQESHAAETEGRPL